ncbi:MAG: amino acid ABC transporter permease [Actinomycetota bacterium]|nr:amino acid ABC transporter permease [Actinomycetota bacterium]
MSSGLRPGLFDTPGPVGVRRQRMANAGVLAVVVLAVGYAIWRFSDQGQLTATKWATFGLWSTWKFLLKGLWYSIYAALGTALLGGALGLLLAVARLSRLAPVRWLATTYVEIMRTIPVLLLIYLTLFGLPKYGINFSLYWKLVLPLAATGAATIAEVIRAGIRSIPTGQREAGLALGMRPAQVMRKVLIPQGLQRVTPSLVSEAVSILKNTSLGFVVSYYELLFSGKILANYTHVLIQTYLVVAVIYLVVNGSLSKWARVLQSRVDARLSGTDRRRQRGKVREKPTGPVVQMIP